ncbi:MAG: thiamine pyrophosphate-binding protein [Betaproteobacteria bacterium]|nr:thiamine pyrophosphate-binding protein [Betaproteobacteria bacterium]
MPKTTGARYFAQVMKGYGITHAFFVPTILMEALAEMDELGIQKILTHGEKAAAYMADGYARALNRPALCMGQQIGASNLAAGLRDAYMAGAPVIAISGGPATASRYRIAYQEVEDFSQFDSMTKLSLQCDDVSRLPDLMRQLFRAVTTGAPKPVHLRLRGSHGQGIEVEADLPAPIIEKEYAVIPAYRPQPETERCKAALAVLARAQRPIIVAGGGVTSSGAQAELVAFAEKLQIPVATSLNAKGAILDTNPLAVGVPGVYSRECANRGISEADLVMFIGSRAGAQVTANWKIPAPGVTVIQVDIDAQELGRNYPNAASVLGDAKATLTHMIALAGAPSASAAAWIKRVQQIVADWRASVAANYHSDAAPIRPERICKEITEALPANGVVVSDTGHAGMWTGQLIDIKHPTQRYIRCAGSLGWGLPGAMGVKCAFPDRPVILFSGDGGFYYHIGELETASRHGINLVMVVNNNSSLNQEIPLVGAAYKDKRGDRYKPDEMWRFQKTANIAKMAEAMGCAAFRVETPAQLRELLPKAMAMNRPVVLDVISDDTALAPTAWTPGGGGGH